MPPQIVQLPPQQPIIEERAFKQTTTKRRIENEQTDDADGDGGVGINGDDDISKVEFSWMIIFSSQYCWQRVVVIVGGTSIAFFFAISRRWLMSDCFQIERERFSSSSSFRSNRFHPPFSYLMAKMMIIATSSFSFSSYILKEYFVSIHPSIRTEIVWMSSLLAVLIYISDALLVGA